MSRAGRLWTVVQRLDSAHTPACPIAVAPFAALTADGFGRIHRESQPLVPLDSLCRSEPLQAGLGADRSVVGLSEVY